nr:MAG TPA: hypothetical protein [Caudoviricetes sp.]
MPMFDYMHAVQLNKPKRAIKKAFGRTKEL